MTSVIQSVRAITSSRNPLQSFLQSSFSLDELLAGAESDAQRVILLKVASLERFNQRDYAAAAELCRRAYDVNEDFESLKNYAFIACQSGPGELLRQANAYVETQLERQREAAEVIALYDALCEGWGRAGEIKKAADFGRRSLNAKDSTAGDSVAVLPRKRPEFDFYQPSRN
ncbi:MAG: hypothetical protein KDA61_12055 [Planctomycetales bacterium]|nr:hypothetical protein [Planctomycetales bacterium]